MALTETKLKLINVGLLGLAFMLVFTAFQVSNKNIVNKGAASITYVVDR